VQPSLTTARLLLRPFGPADAPAVQKLAGDFKIADTTALMPHPYPDGAAEAWIASLPPEFETRTHVTFAVVRRDGGELVGAAGLRIEATHARADLGYWIGVPFWGQGYATEAARALVDYGFQSLLLNRISAEHLTRNPASGRVLQKIGMTYEGTHREFHRKWDVLEDVAVYAVLAREWPGVGPGS
jgi:[ribosomal protein S5]-alanine N-acetyltransferase